MKKSIQRNSIISLDLLYAAQLICLLFSVIALFFPQNLAGGYLFVRSTFIGSVCVSSRMFARFILEKVVQGKKLEIKANDEHHPVASNPLIGFKLLNLILGFLSEFLLFQFLRKAVSILDYNLSFFLGMFCLEKKISKKQPKTLKSHHFQTDSL